MPYLILAGPSNSRQHPIHLRRPHAIRLQLILHDLEKGRARAPCLPLFAIGVDPRFDYFPGVCSLDNLVFLRRIASQLRKAKPRSILASDGNLPRCHQRHMERRREGITPALFRKKAAQFLSPCSGPADHLHGRSYLLFRRQPLPSQHSLLQRGAVRQSAGPVVQSRRPAGIDIDFVIVAHWRPRKVHLRSQYPINRRTANVQPLPLPVSRGRAHHQADKRWLFAARTAR